MGDIVITPASNDVNSTGGTLNIRASDAYPLLLKTSNVERISITAAGLVGIGTTAPTGKLHIYSSITGDTLLRADGTNGTIFSVTDDLSNSLLSVNNSAGIPVLEVFADDSVVMGQYGSGDFVLRNNKIGIGTTNPAYKLEVNGNFAAGGTSTIGTTYPQLTINGATNQHAYVVINRTNYEAGVQLRTNGTAKWYMYMPVADDTALIFASQAYGDSLTIKNNGNVGVGIGNPIEKLTVSGNLQLSGSAGASLNINTNNAGNGNISFDGTTFTIVSNSNSAPLILSTSSFERMRIASDGKVGIGTSVITGLLNVTRNSNTAQPIAFFKELFANPAATNLLLLERGNNLSAANQISSNAGLRIRDHSSNYSLSIEDHNSNVNFAISGTRVLVGSTTATSLLNIGGAGSTFPASGITFGGDAQANLYRVTEDTIRTDGSLIAVGSLDVGNGITSSSQFRLGTYLGYISTYPSIATAAFRWVILGPYNDTLSVAGNGLRVRGELFFSRGSNGENLRNARLKINIAQGYNKDLLHADVLSIDSDTTTAQPILYSVYISGFTSKYFAIDASQLVSFSESQLDASTVYYNGQFYDQSNDARALTIQPNTAVTGAIGVVSRGGKIANALFAYTGNIGIGTVTPAYKLDVFESSSADVARFYNNGSSCNFYVGSTNNTAATDIILYTSNGNAQFFKNRSSTSWGGADSLNIYTSNGGIAFHPAGETNAVYFTTNGRVGIGITSPLQKLQVDGAVGNPASVGVTQSGIFRISNTTDNAVLDFGIRAGGLGAWIQSTDETSLAANYPLLLNPNGGNIGIGLTVPTDKIQISGGGISFTTSTGLAVPMLGMTSLNVAYVGPYSTTTDGNAPATVLFNQGASVLQVNFYSSGRAAMTLNRQGRLNIAGNLGNTPPALLNVGPSSSVDAVSGMSFGNDASANLYRSAASTIKTDGSLEVTTSLNIGADLYVADELGVGVLIANKRVNYGAQINAASASIQLVLGRTTSSTGQGAIGADSANTFAVWNVSGGFTKQFVVTQQGNVGIGTDTPSQKLHVYARGNGAGILIESDATVDANQAPALKLYPKSPSVNERNWAISPFRDYPQSLSIASSNDKGGDPYSNATTRMLIDGLNGNVGIGTALPNSLLNVHGATPFVRINTTATADHGIKISYDNSDTHGLHLLYNANNALSFIDNTYPTASSQVYGDIYFRQNVAGTMTTRMAIKADGGNVGIGTTNPLSTLHLYGTAPTILTLGSTSYPSTFLTTLGVDSGARGFLIFGNNGENQIRAGRTSTGGYLDFYTNNTVGQTTTASDGNLVMRLAANGNVGIGTTNPATLLHVDTAGDDARIRVSAGTNTVQGGMIANSGTSLVYAGSITNHGFSLRTNDTDRVRIDTNGNVGIGTVSPIGKLTVQGNIEVNYNSTTADSFVRRTFLAQHAVINRGANIKFGLIDGGGLAGMGVYNVVSSDTGYNSQFIAFNTHQGNVSADERMRITQLGDVGIGTFTPLSLLTVGAAGSTTAAKGLSFGGDAQANLYRSAEDTIKTDGNLIVAVNTTTASLDVAGIATAQYEEGQNQYSFRGANRAINDWDYTGLTNNPQANSYLDGSWFIDAGASNNWDRGILSKRRFRRVEGLTLEYETFTQDNDGSGIFTMIGFVGGNSVSPNYNQIPANLIYQANNSIDIYTNGGSSGSDYAFDTRNAWWRFKTVLKGRGALHYVYRDNKWNLIKETSTNDQNDYEYLRVVFSLFRQRVYIRDLKVYVAQESFRGSNYLDNVIGNLFVNGSVGIGSTSPAFKLDVLGNLRVSGTTSTVGSFRSSASSCFISLIDSSNDNVFLGNDDGDFLIQTPTTSYSTKLIVKDGGNVGIGTDNPTAKLVVMGEDIYNYAKSSVPTAIVADSVPEFLIGSTDNIDGEEITLRMGSVLNTYYTHGAYVKAIQGAGVDYYKLAFGTSNGAAATTKMTITNDGNVGIGTTNPSNKLVVYDDKDTSTWNSSASSVISNITIHNFASAINKPAVIELVQNDHSVVRLVGYKPDATTYWLSNFGISVRKADTNMHQVFTAQYDGNIGIGSTTPGAKLDVVGNINIDGPSFHRIANDSIITAPSDHGLVAYYGFDEGSSLLISDKTGRNNTSALGLTYTTTAIRGTALDGFGGNNNYVVVPDSTDFDFGTGDFAVSLWCRPSSSFTGVNNTLIEIGLYTAGILIRPQANTNTLEIYIQGSFITQPTIVWAANVWYHIVVTRISSVLNVYSNGTRIASVANTSNIQVSSAGYIGRSAHAVGQFFYGIIDEVKIYKGKGLDYGEVRGQYLSRGDSMLVAPIFSTTNGNVGIGTTNPLAPLHVGLGGDWPSSTGTSAMVFIKQKSSNVGLVIQEPGNASFDRALHLYTNGSLATIDATYRDTGPYPDIAFVTSGTVRARINSDGNVGIGIANPSQKLHVVGAGRFTTDLLVGSESVRISTDGAGELGIGYGSTATNVRFAIYNNTTAAFLVKPNGQIGIGTVTPLSLLTVGPAGSTTAASGITLGGDSVANLYRISASRIKTDGFLTIDGGGGGATNLLLNRSSSSNENGMAFTTAGSVDWYYYVDNGTTNLQIQRGSEADAAPRVRFNGANSDILFNLGGGNIGVGTATPTGKLHIYSTITGQTLIRADGTNGTIFSVVDDLSNSLLSVNNSAGIPVLEVFADDSIVMGQYGSGDLVVASNKVGIGTTNPTNKLSVIGGASIGSTTYNIAAPSNGLIVQGNVGIGTTNPSSILHLYKADPNFIIQTNGGSNSAITLTDGSSNGYLIKNVSAGTANGSLAGALYTYTDSNKAFQHIHAGTPLFTILSVGNVGIGVTNPSDKFIVNGNIGFAGDTNRYFYMPDTYQGTGSIYMQAGFGSASAGGGIRLFGHLATTYIGGDVEIGLSQKGDFLINTHLGGTRLVTVKQNGNVGIGRTNPAYKFEVSGGDVNIAGANVLRFGTVAVLNTASSPNDIYANIRVLRNESTVNTDGMYIGYNSAGTTSAHLRFYANGTNERMRIQANDGHVGIGTDNALGKLDVYGDVNGDHVSFVRNANAGSNAITAIVFRRNGGNNGLVMFTNSSARTNDGGAGNSTIRTDNGKLLLGSNGTTYHALETDGNVGIGLTNPVAARLHIKGDGSNPVLRVESALLQGAAGGTAGKTFVGWMPIQTGALSPADTVYIPLYK